MTLAEQTINGFIAYLSRMAFDDFKLPAKSSDKKCHVHPVIQCDHYYDHYVNGTALRTQIYYLEPRDIPADPLFFDDGMRDVTTIIKQFLTGEEKTKELYLLTPDEALAGKIFDTYRQINQHVCLRDIDQRLRVICAKPDGVFEMKDIL